MAGRGSTNIFSTTSSSSSNVIRSRDNHPPSPPVRLRFGHRLHLYASFFLLFLGLNYSYVNPLNDFTVFGHMFITVYQRT